MMRDHGIGSLAVTDEKGGLVGIITERDIINRVVSMAVDPASTPVLEVMTAQAASLPEGASIADAQQLMSSRGIRHIPIVDSHDKAVGMISSRDIMTHQVMSDRAMRSAAEQVAKLSTLLKSLDFDEVIDIAIHQVPAIFHAERSLISFRCEESDTDDPMLVRHNMCVCPGKSQFAREDVCKAFETGEIHLGDIPPACRKLVGVSPNLVLPLEFSQYPRQITGKKKEMVRGVLCMCCLNTPVERIQELRWYKGALVREVLNANLTNAKLYQSARTDSLTDALTSVGSRRLFEEKLEEEFVRSQRYERPFCVGMLDIDHFKLINDRQGHTKGDDALCKFAACIADEKRASDILARYGGDEFALLMPETPIDGAVSVLERIRRKTESTRQSAPGGTVSGRGTRPVPSWNYPRPSKPRSSMNSSDA
jgi:diguanylate cyclase (GGDEF)-like protein